MLERLANSPTSIEEIGLWYMFLWWQEHVGRRKEGRTMEETHRVLMDLVLAKASTGSEVTEVLCMSLQSHN